MQIRANLIRFAVRLAGLSVMTLAAACSSPAAPQPAPTAAAPVATLYAPSPAAETEAPAPAAAAAEPLAVTFFYPTAETPVRRGQEIRFTLQAAGPDGALRTDAQAALRVYDAGGGLVAELPAEPGRGDIYRSASWSVPPGTPAGEWRVEAELTGPAQGTAESFFTVQPSLSDMLLEKYGFWIDPPTLGEIQPALAAEKGDGQNGEIIWGGVRPALHIFPENWVEIHWRTGEYDLSDESAVERFLLEELGEIGFTPLRALGPYERFRFKDWEAWKVRARGETREHLIEWVVFYAPEVDKTYAISTMVVLPPAVGDPHAFLRQSFRVDPEAPADGTAPEPLADLLPGPELLGPELGERFSGTGEPVVLAWAPVKELAEDEYYEILVDYYVRENQPKVRFTTRETRLELPTELYSTPTCRFYNWQVQLLRQTGVDSNGDPVGEPVSFRSLYRYLWWQTAPGDEVEVVTCAYSHIE